MQGRESPSPPHQSQYTLSEEEQRCLDTISSFEKFYNFKNHESLVRIFLSKPLSEAFFNSNKIEISSLFGGGEKEENQEENNRHFARKYSFERLCDKFIYPKGTSNTFRRIVRHKLKTEYIESHNTRKQVWLLASGAKYSMKIQKGMFKALHEMDNYPESYSRAIDLDLNRTAGKDSPEGMMQAMRRILVAFSRKNPFIGYCQGLNFIAHFILTMQFTEQEGFWLLSQMLETIIPMDYYTNMIGVVTDQRIFLEVLRQYNPRIANKFKEVGLDPSIFTIEWFVCLFTSSVPFYLVRIIWDRLIIEGTSALLKTGIILLEEFEAEILKAAQFPDIIILVEQRSKKLSMSELEFNLRYEKIYICRRILQLARDIYRQLYIKEKLAEKLVKVNNKRTFAEIKCNRGWPVCLQVLDRNKKEREDCYAWTFKRLDPIQINKNYLDELDSKSSHLRGVNGSAIERSISFRHEPVTNPSQLIIGRMEHICQPERPVKTETLQLPKMPLQKHLSKSQMVIPLEQEQDQREEEEVMNLSFLETAPRMNDKTAQRLKRAKSIYFYQQFILNNKELGEIIANDSLAKSQD